MTPFLQQIARLYYRQLGKEINKCVFVFPNRRSGIFFQKYLAIEAGHPIFSPKILTINELFGEMSQSKLVDRISLLFRLYRIFIKKSGSDESFDDFIYWGEMLLNDFDDVDKYVADAQKLFCNVTDLKMIDTEFAYLEESQVQAIREFWSHFIPSYESDKKEKFARTWEVLYDMYSQLRGELAAQSLAYEGMVFRDVAEALQEHRIQHSPYPHIVFVGLNAMTKAERILLAALRDMGVADFYWDYVASSLRDKDNKASFFTDENLRDFPSRYQLPPEVFLQPRIEVIGVPSAVGQTKCAYSILDELISKGEIPNPSHAMNTAVVLPDENLLIPMLYSVPQNIDPINVTMGYSLKSTPVAGLMEHIFDLLQNIRWEKGQPMFYFRAAEPILTHRYVTAFTQEHSFAIIDDAKKKNRIFLPVEDFASDELLSLIFRPIKDVQQLSAYLRQLLEYLQSGLGRNDDPEQQDRQSVRLNEVEREFIYHYYITLNRLEDVLKENSVTFNISTYFRLLRKMTDIVTIPFHGEPLSGLQVMGVLETRALDFENLVILSMNEGVFPLKKATNSFIPFNLRKGFGLSTSEHQDSVYAYHFYRMISRAKNVYLLYDTRDSGMQTGEVSRYVYQLKYHYGYNLVEKNLSFDISVAEAPAIAVKKSPKVMAELSRYMVEGGRSLSASAINKYINCPLEFYFHYIEGMKEEDDVSEKLESDQFGTIFHAVMEDLYNRCRNQMVTADVLQRMIDDEQLLRDKIREKFVEVYLKKQEHLTGMNYLLCEVFYKYVHKSLVEDLKRTPFIYVESEMKMNDTFLLSDGRKVNLTGSIDRVTQQQDVVSIVDYKTGGRGNLDFASVDQLFDKTLKFRPKEIMQVMMYALLYNQARHPSAIQPHIFYLTKLYETKVESVINCKLPRNAAPGSFSEGPVNNFLDWKKEFASAFDSCLSEIFNSEIPFDQTCVEDHCQYCQFRSICRR